MEISELAEWFKNQIVTDIIDKKDDDHSCNDILQYIDNEEIQNFVQTNYNMIFALKTFSEKNLLKIDDGQKERRTFDNLDHLNTKRRFNEARKFCDERTEFRASRQGMYNSLKTNIEKSFAKTGLINRAVKNLEETKKIKRERKRINRESGLNKLTPQEKRALFNDDVEDEN